MRLRLLFFVTALVLAAQPALAVTSQMAHQGRLLDVEAAPLEGDHTLEFALYDAATGGAVIWSESVDVNMVGGFYSVVLGADETGNPLDDLVLSNPPLWLQLTVDGGEPLQPRHKLVSVPYSVRSGTATNIEGGFVDASEVAIDGTLVIDADGNWVGPTPDVDFAGLTGVPAGLADGEDADALAALACGSGERPSWDGSAGQWACTPVGWSELQGIPADVLAPDGDLLAALSCSDGGLAIFEAASGSWVCGSPAALTTSEVVDLLLGADLELGAGSLLDGALLATLDDLAWSLLTGVPADLADGDADTLGAVGPCSEGEIPKFDAVAGSWACGFDAVLGAGDVLGIVDGASVDLGAGSSMAAAGLATVDDLTWGSLAGVPADFADGSDADALTALGASCTDGDRPGWDSVAGTWGCLPDLDTVLSEQEVEDFVFDEPVDLPAGSTVGGDAISSGSSGLFGGTGADGPLVVTAGTTTIDVGGAPFFELNHTSVEISGSGQLAFSGPNENGTVVILRSQGDVEVSSTPGPSIDVSGMGGQSIGTRDGRNNLGDGAGTDADWYLVPVAASRQVRITTGSAAAPATTVTGWDTYTEDTIGGAGGGALWVEAAGALDFSGSIAADGLDGMDAATGCAGGAGGGSGGQVVILHNGLTTNTGTITNTGGDGGNGDWTDCPTLLSNWFNTRLAGTNGASALGGAGGASHWFTPCPGTAAYGGGGGAGGGSPGLESYCSQVGATGGASGSNQVIQNTVFP
jgi:hypothetical protein